MDDILLLMRYGYELEFSKDVNTGKFVISMTNTYSGESIRKEFDDHDIVVNSGLDIFDDYLTRSVKDMARQLVTSSQLEVMIYGY